MFLAQFPDPPMPVHSIMFFKKPHFFVGVVGEVFYKIIDYVPDSVYPEVFLQQFFVGWIFWFIVVFTFYFIVRVVKMINWK